MTTAAWYEGYTARDCRAPRRCPRYIRGLDRDDWYSGYDACNTFIASDREAQTIERHNSNR